MNHKRRATRVEAAPGDGEAMALDVTDAAAADDDDERASGPLPTGRNGEPNLAGHPILTLFAFRAFCIQAPVLLWWPSYAASAEHVSLRNDSIQSEICATKTNISIANNATRDKAPKLIGPMPHNIKYIYVQLSSKHAEDNASVANMLSGNSEEAAEAYALASREVLIRFIFKFTLKRLLFSLAQDLRIQLSHPDASDQGKGVDNFKVTTHKD